MDFRNETVDWDCSVSLGVILWCKWEQIKRTV